MVNPEELVAGVDTRRHPTALTLATELVWQAGKLRDTRETIDENQMAPVISYDNGGGQTGIRRNPLYDAYNSLFAQFTRGCAQLDNILADTPASTSAKGALASLRVVAGRSA